MYMFIIRNVYTWYKHVYTFTSLYIVHGINMYILTCKCINMFIPCIYIPDHKHVYTLCIHGIYMFQLAYTYSEIYVHHDDHMYSEIYVHHDDHM